MILDNDPEEVKVGDNSKEYSRKRYHIGWNYALQIGDVNFQNGGNMEALYFIRGGVEPGSGAGFTCNIPARIIPGVLIGLKTLLKDSGMSDSSDDSISEIPLKKKTSRR